MKYEGITIAADKEATYTGVLVTGNKQDFIDYLRRRFNNPHGSELLLRISLPCGSQVMYRTEDDVPDVDTPCPCGNPKHWIIRYQQAERSRNEV